MPCQCCKFRAAVMTITELSGSYSLCRFCAYTWGKRVCGAEKVELAAQEVLELQALWAMPSRMEGR